MHMILPLPKKPRIIVEARLTLRQAQDDMGNGK